MSAHNIRFGSVIAFDEESELDIIKFLEGLNSSHKMGQFIAALIRTAVDNPELIKKTENGLQLTSLMNQLEANLVSSSRDVFFSYVKEELRRMVDKVNSVYDIAFKTYTLAQMNKALGLEQQSENNLLACFVLE